jgi:hypothetical protein
MLFLVGYVIIGSVCAVCFAWLVLTTATDTNTPEPSQARVLPLEPRARHVPRAARLEDPEEWWYIGS